ncbi:uncharacterized protein BJ212DRAFT_1480019 [Suillus subaureus]|uniref:Uncharacterized protein n=1 Tax=Suillus subaureus TaxID=48587 RepID=A0A9P7ED46_9AGAM|nr:uncharacterized protein BJ212DRAFT_1480019 [Suillus subaureus]KAG1818202.1 hypothetical protein BJ212DRAFT_1480019 [Suillus subaureus]
MVCWPVTAICDIHPTTVNEILLLAALHEAEAANVTLKKCDIALQASNILNEMYCAKICSQLAHQELKKQAGNNGGKILGDGLPHLLSGDEFYERVIQFEEAQTRAAAKKRTRTKEQKRHAEALADWKKLEDAKKAENKANSPSPLSHRITLFSDLLVALWTHTFSSAFVSHLLRLVALVIRRERYHEALQIWESEKAHAKEEKWKLTEKKPTLGKLIAAIPWPKAIKTEEAQEGESDGKYFDLDDVGSCTSNKY